MEPGQVNELRCRYCGATGQRLVARGPEQSWGRRYRCADCMAEFDVPVTQGRPMRPCANELCRGLIAGGAALAYCCGACALAAERGYEIHESGPLAHSAACIARQAERGMHPVHGPIR